MVILNRHSYLNHHISCTIAREMAIRQLRYEKKPVCMHHLLRMLCNSRVPGIFGSLKKLSGLVKAFHNDIYSSIIPFKIETPYEAKCLASAFRI